ncbi:hypothetical protein FPOAC2_13175 [Fusarium poae]|jgi:hypothetical protein|uniref:hypothetical protein n=1 Tax=Fusarium poae TaxID=36050 RepID=UPI001CE80EE9|nr:hypothetical protein FPOAC1_012805 [Fusarium poae]KAG8667963.1 hypothetical protein FPOAC1_012805 [Fusarium poae]
MDGLQPWLSLSIFAGGQRLFTFSTRDKWFKVRDLTYASLIQTIPADGFNFGMDLISGTGSNIAYFCSDHKTTRLLDLAGGHHQVLDGPKQAFELRGIYGSEAPPV